MSRPAGFCRVKLKCDSSPGSLLKLGRKQQMRIFLAGATGAIGRPLVRQLLEAGHDVTGMTRHEENALWLRQAGARAAVCDAFDSKALIKAVAESKPDALIDQLTAIPTEINPRKVAQQFAATNRLRTEGTRNVIAAARQAGVHRIVAQSIAFAYRPGGNNVKTEDDPLWDDAPSSFRSLFDSIANLEQQILAVPESVVLRYGFFYGPGTAYAKDGSVAVMVRKRHFPLVGNGRGMFSFIHVNDAAFATAAALERGAAGIYNVVDDEPAPASEWLPAYAEALGAPKPRQLPKLIAQIVAGAYGVYLMTKQRGASNGKAKRELSWSPRCASWRTGFREALV
jgi:nucleoside-diphosphate-sugar epimerase